MHSSVQAVSNIHEEVFAVVTEVFQNKSNILCNYKFGYLH